MGKSIIKIEVSGKTVYQNISRFLGLFVSTKILFSENLKSLKLMKVRPAMFRLDQIGTKFFPHFKVKWPSLMMSLIDTKSSCFHFLCAVKFNLSLLDVKTKPALVTTLS